MRHAGTRSARWIMIATTAAGGALGTAAGPVAEAANQACKSASVTDMANDVYTQVVVDGSVQAQQPGIDPSVDITAANVRSDAAGMHVAFVVQQLVPDAVTDSERPPSGQWNLSFRSGRDTYEIHIGGANPVVNVYGSPFKSWGGYHVVRNGRELSRATGGYDATSNTVYLLAPAVRLAGALTSVQATAVQMLDNDGAAGHSLQVTDRDVIPSSTVALRPCSA